MRAHRIIRLRSLSHRFTRLILATLSILIVGGAPTIRAYAQDISVIQQFSINDGLDQRTVWHVIRDCDGKFVIFTEGKIQVFNGHQFRYLPLADGLRMDRSTDVVQVGDHEIYIGDRTASNYLLDTRSERWYALPALSSGQAYLPCSEGLYRSSTARENQSTHKLDSLSLMDDKLSWTEVINYNSPRAPYDIIYHPEGGLTTLDAQGMLRQYLDSAAVDSLCCVTQLLGWVHGKLYVQSGSRVLTYRVKSGWKTENLFGGSRILLRTDDKGNGLLGTSGDPRFVNQTYLITRDSIVHLTEIPYVKNTILDYQSSDFAHKILLATYNGLYVLRYDTGLEKLVSDPNYIEGDFARVIWWIKQARNRRIYYFRETQGLYSLDSISGTVKLLPNDQYPLLQSSNYFAHLYGDDRYIMIAGVLPSPAISIYDTETGLYRSTPTDSARYRDFYQLTDTTVLLVGADQTQARIGIYNTSSHEIRTRWINREYGTQYYDIHESESDLYLATNTGAYTFSKAAVMSDPDTLIMTQLSDEPCRSVHFDQGVLAIGGSGGGLFIHDLHSGKMDSLSTASGLVDDVIVTMQKSPMGDLWMCTWRGIAILDSNYVHRRNLRVHDGLSSNETNSQSLLFADDGYAYIGTINGISKIPISTPQTEHECTNLILEGLSYSRDGRVESKEISSADEIIIPYSIDEITLDFTPYDYISNATVNDFLNDHQFSIDDKVLPLNTAAKLALYDLPRGMTQLAWLKRNSSGALQPHQNISIYRETFLDRYSFHVLVGFLILGLLAYIWYIRKQRLEDQALSIKRKQTAQINELRLTALRSQMNPHFLFNALGSIQYYIQRNDSDLAEEYLTDFATLMRGILDASITDTIRLRDELELLALYVKMEQLRMDRQFQYHVDVADDVDLSYPLPPMILQPFVENAILHGIFHLSTDDGQLHLAIEELSEDKLQVQIIDNGVGRKRSQELKNNTHVSRATNIVNERLQLINLTQGNSFSYHIEDNPAGRGTLVTVIFEID